MEKLKIEIERLLKDYYEEYGRCIDSIYVSNIINHTGERDYLLINKIEIIDFCKNER